MAYTVRSIEGNVRSCPPLSDERDAELFLRCLSYQQFWVLRIESIPIGLSHQLMLFGNLDPNHPHSVTFRRLTKISIVDFIDLSTFMFCKLLDDRAKNRRTLHITKDTFSPIEASFGSDKIGRFLDSISATVEASRTYLKKHSKYYSNISEEYFEMSPLIRYPLIKHDDYYFVIAEILLLSSLSTFVADVLRCYDAQWFMREFGRPMFESLIADSLSSLDVNFITEDDLEQYFGGRRGRKYVDFLIVDRGLQYLHRSKGRRLEMGCNGN